MNPRGNTLRLTAVSALVVLTLTGFSTGRGHGGSGDGGGGGCSNSSQDHDSSSSSGGGSHRDYDDDDDYGDAGDGGGSASSSELGALVDLVDCASEETPYATVEVTNQNTADGVFTVTVRFEDETGAEVLTRSQDVAVPGTGTVPVRVEIGDADVTRIAECEPDMIAEPAG
ncbi:hypothetical protein B7767_41500 [Streptomyces sp. 13-12-16]|uniref:hypothetical protein n=1 Tax=Streptomyces sp. 13-12-16 TaxID=1570823 RepID=UPI000A1DC8A3|nr:hypothetical protein [Streptomyces sp. 13-12-16]OSP27429.1 hypothetical protein B7767_41500 [Streptomyces sp. 13-12-16]